MTVAVARRDSRLPQKGLVPTAIVLVHQLERDRIVETNCRATAFLYQAAYPYPAALQPINRPTGSL